MKYFSRLPLPISAALFLTAATLGTLAKPASADVTGFLNLINSYRQQNGVGSLAEDQNLTNAACWLAADLDINGFSHTDSQGRSMSQRLTDFGVSGFRAENIFYTTSGSGAQYAFDSWKNSSGHNTNMLNPTYTRIGIGRTNINGKWYWATDFANNTATSLTSQCEVAVTSPSPLPTKPSQPPTTSNPSKQTVEIPVTITEPIPTATIAAAPAILDLSTRSATLSSRIVKFETDSAEQEHRSLVKGLAIGSVILWDLALFSLIFWKLLHYFQ